MTDQPTVRSEEPERSQIQRPNRRNFLKVAGGIVGASSLTMAGCDLIFDGDDDGRDPQKIILDFSDDFGVLNYAYLLEQLEARFYELGVAISVDTLSDLEYEYFQDIAVHEAAHRDFFSVALGSNAIMDATFDFTDSVDFKEREDVLEFAQLLEDTGVSAYNGAGSELQSETFLTIAGKIVSVEARHAATLRALVSDDPHAFADLEEIERGAVPEKGLDAALPPDVVLEAVDELDVLENEVEIRNL